MNETQNHHLREVRSLRVKKYSLRTSCRQKKARCHKFVEHGDNCLRTIQKKHFMLAKEENYQPLLIPIFITD